MHVLLRNRFGKARFAVQAFLTLRESTRLIVSFLIFPAMAFFPGAAVSPKFRVSISRQLAATGPPRITLTYQNTNEAKAARTALIAKQVFPVNTLGVGEIHLTIDLSRRVREQRIQALLALHELDERQLRALLNGISSFGRDVSLFLWAHLSAAMTHLHGSPFVLRW